MALGSSDSQARLTLRLRSARDCRAFQIVQQLRDSIARLHRYVGIVQYIYFENHGGS